MADLTTQAALRLAWNITTASIVDAALPALISQVSDLIQGPTYCDRQFAQATVTEYPEPLSGVVGALFADRPPIGTITSLHWSTALPRVYDSTTLLVEGTDYVVSADARSLEMATSRLACSPRAKMAKLVYQGGYATLPGDIVRACQEIIAVKVYKATGHLYHFQSVTAADGAIQGARFDDVTPDAERVLNAYRLRTFA